MKKTKIKMKTYKQCFKYLGESKAYFLVVALVLVISAFIAFTFPVPNAFIDILRKLLEDIIAQTEGMNFIQLFVFIFQNNFMTSLFGLILGIILGLFPLLLSFLNGYFLGFVSKLSVTMGGASSLWRLLPHGIFEMPALIISLGLGLKLGMFVFAKKGKRKKQLKYDLENSLRVFLFVVIPLLLIAGIIETALIFLFG